MERKEITCIGCPMGCNLEVEIVGENNITVKGCSCKKGEIYGIKECTNPTRIVTSTVWVEGGEEDTVPVKTAGDIPKSKIFDCIKELKNLCVKAPVSIGDIIVENILGTGVNIIATRNIAKK